MKPTLSVYLFHHLLTIARWMHVWEQVDVAPRSSRRFHFALWTAKRLYNQLKQLDDGRTPAARSPCFTPTHSLPIGCCSVPWKTGRPSSQHTSRSLNSDFFNYVWLVSSILPLIPREHMARVHRMKRTDIHSCNLLKRFSTRGILPVTILGVGCHLRTILKTACDMHFEAVSLDGDHARFSFAIGICRTNDFTAKRFYRWSFPTQFLSISFHH